MTQFQCDSEPFQSDEHTCHYSASLKTGSPVVLNVIIFRVFWVPCMRTRHSYRALNVMHWHKILRLQCSYNLE